MILTSNSLFTKHLYFTKYQRFTKCVGLPNRQVAPPSVVVALQLYNISPGILEITPVAAEAVRVV
jgi:hypothetical protein